MTLKKRNNVILLVIFIFAIMLFDAVAENLRGVFIPIFKNSFGIDGGFIGNMLAVGSLAYVIFTYIGGLLCRKFGQKRVFILGIISMIISLMMFSITHNAYVLLIDMFIMNIGLSLTSIAINTLVPVLVTGFQSVLMNITHLFYGLGAAGAPSAAAFLLEKGISWRTIYLGVAIVFIAILIIFSLLDTPNVHEKEQDKKLRFTNILHNKLYYYYAFGLGFYVFAELAIGSWFVNFIQDNYNYSIGKSSFYLTVFFAVFTLGRLLGGFIVEKFGYLKTVLNFLIIAVCMFTAGVIMKERGLMLISLSGFFFSITFPTVVTTISKVFKEDASYITGVIVASVSSVNIILTKVIGEFNDKIGTYLSFYIIPISLLISIIFMYLIYINTKKCFRDKNING